MSRTCRSSSARSSPARAPRRLALALACAPLLAFSVPSLPLDHPTVDVGGSVSGPIVGLSADTLPKGTFTLGWRLDWSDPLLLGHLSSTVSWSPDRDLPSSERSHASIAYRRYDWRAHASWNDADFYDLFGPTKRSRKGWDAGLGWSRLITQPSAPCSSWWPISTTVCTKLGSRSAGVAMSRYGKPNSSTAAA